MYVEGVGVDRSRETKPHVQDLCSGHVGNDPPPLSMILIFIYDDGDEFD